MMQGRNVAAALAGAWRAASAVFKLDSEALRLVAPLLAETGAAALAWHWIAGSAIRAPHARRLLRLNAIETQQLALARLHQIERTLTILHAAGIEPILVKGWSAARLYAEPADRPLGDIDLCVAPAQWESAQEVLDQHPLAALDVDLHYGVADLDERGWNEIHERSRRVPLGNSEVRVLGPEDHLRHLSLHFMRHGAWRPLWLCDVAAALEARPADFDWDYFLHGQRWLTDWALAAIALAGRLLGARLPPRLADLRSPRWLEETVLRLWSAGAASSDTVHAPLASQLRSWSGIRDAVKMHWPNPIRAAFKLRRSPFTRLPRRLLQATAFGWRALQVASERLRRSRDLRPRAYDLHLAR